VEWVFNATSRPLYPLGNPGTHCIGGWVGPGNGLDDCGKYRADRGSVLGPSSLYVIWVCFLVYLFLRQTRKQTHITKDVHSLDIAVTMYKVIQNDCRGHVTPLPASIPELEVRIRTAIQTITTDMRNELDYRVDVCRITKGAHIEHLYGM